MNEDAFDRFARRLMAGTSRRSAVGGVLGGVVALLTSAVGLKAQGRGNGLALGRGTADPAAGRGVGPAAGRAGVGASGDVEVDEVEVGLGRRKVSICHEGWVITVGSPALNAHLRKHEDGECANACQVYTKGGPCTVNGSGAQCACSDERLTADAAMVDLDPDDAVVDDAQRATPRDRKDPKRARRRARVEARRVENLDR